MAQTPTSGVCHLCGHDGRAFHHERESDGKTFLLCYGCAQTEARRRDHGGPTLLIAATAMPEGDDG